MSPLSAPALLGVAAAGALGAVARHVAGHWTARLVAARLPEGVLGLTGPMAGTLLVNVVGSFALGVAAGLAVDRLPPGVKLAATTGFLGSFTTFSTFSVQTVRLAEQGWGPALLNVGLELGLGLAAAGAGLALARSLG